MRGLRQTENCLEWWLSSSFGRWLSFSLSLSLTLSLLFSCENKWPKDTTLEGQWQVLEIRKGDRILNVKEDHVFWNIQLGVLMFENKESHVYYAHYNHTGDSILITDMAFISAYEKATDDDTPMTQEDVDEYLTQFGISKVDEGFRVITLSDERMALESKDAMLEFVKR